MPQSTLADFGIENVKSYPATARRRLAAGLVRRVRASERLPGDRIPAHPDEQLQLRFGDLVTRRDEAGADAGKSAAHPTPRWRALRAVVARQRRRHRPLPVAGCDRAQQVPESVAGTHHPHRHRHRATSVVAEKVRALDLQEAWDHSAGSHGSDPARS